MYRLVLTFVILVMSFVNLAHDPAIARDCAVLAPSPDCAANEQIVARAVFAAVKSMDEKQVRALTDAGADLSVTDKSGWTVLMWAALIGRTRIVKPILENGGDANYSAPDGSTPILVAALQGNGAVARLLIEYGSDPNQADNEGLTPLQAAALRGHPKTAKILVAGGADQNAKFRDGTAIFTNKKMKPNFSKVTLSDAAVAGDVGLANAKLGSVPDLNAIEVGSFNPLMFAALKGNAPVVRLLLENGADANVVHGNYTPLIAAVHGRNARALRLIYKRSNRYIRNWRPARYAASAADIAEAYAAYENRRDLLDVFRQ